MARAFDAAPEPAPFQLALFEAKGQAQMSDAYGTTTYPASFAAVTVSLKPGSDMTVSRTDLSIIWGNGHGSCQVKQRQF